MMQKVNAVRFAAEGSVLFSASYDRTIRAWDLRSHIHEPMDTIDVFKDSVSSIAVTNTELIAGYSRYDLVSTELSKVC